MTAADDGPVGEVPPLSGGWSADMPNAHAYCETTIHALRAEVARLTAVHDENVREGRYLRALLAATEATSIGYAADLAEAREGFDRWREIGNAQAARADIAEARLRAVEALIESALDSSLTGIDVDPFWRCICGVLWPCPEASRIRAALSSDVAPQAHERCASNYAGYDGTGSALPCNCRAAPHAAGVTRGTVVSILARARPGDVRSETVDDAITVARALGIPVADAPAAPEGER